MDYENENSYNSISDEEDTLNAQNPAENSSERSKIKRIPVTPELRKWAIALPLEGNGNTMISRILGIPRTTVLSIVSNFYKKGQDKSKRRGGDHSSKLSIVHKTAIIN